MTTYLATASVDADIVAVGDSWIQDQADKFVHLKLPKARSNRIISGYSGTVNWKIPNLENFLLAGNGLQLWGPGQDLPADKGLAATDVAAKFYSKIARPRSRNINQGTPRYSDLASNIVPGMTSELWQGRERELVNFFNATNYGTLLTFTGDVLDTDADATNTQPYLDIQNNLTSLRPLRAIPGLELHCFMSEDVAYVLAAHVDYHGAGAGSAIATGVALPTFFEIFKAKHGLDAIHNLGSAANTANYGATASVDFVGGGGVLAFVLVDTRTSDFDIRHGANPDFSPDGGLVLVMSDFDVEINSQVYGDQGIERFVARTEFGFVNPRGTSFGQVYDPAEIIT